ncbi:DNA-3-methyladenine glycosylase [Pseudohongiella nitratireducens]|uniref:DNA-3-methyladenine glycosylase II n=1 Tax=Pseudohongiella nitratireducens TaxID=1768907 RepID=A0A917GMW1_9GAMM|nr:DNA-3-methyladenine glycosylase [Pseudohongiella nitratireducens]GGG51374.1 DNA-3-methyladenine glycosylase [Pseudohongiella nitratireducens]
MPQNKMIDETAALTHFRKHDPVMAELIAVVGDFAMPVKTVDDLFGTLLDAITSQQLSGKAAATIFGRVCALHGNPEVAPTPVQIIKSSDESLRAAGLPRAKVAAVKDLAEKVQSGHLPALSELRERDDDDIVKCLVDVRGIGRWTAEMFLLFQLGRPDVLPANDLGVQKGFMMRYGLDAMPKPAELLEFGERWRPHRSVATWYLWQATRL